MRIKSVATLLTLVILLAGLWLYFQPAPTSVNPAAVTETTAPAPVFQFRVSKSAVTGPGTMVVRQGQNVRIVVESDVPDEIHLHGYNLSMQLNPGMPQTLEFTATHAGRFELELHKQHLQLGTLEVYPGDR